MGIQYFSFLYILEVDLIKRMGLVTLQGFQRIFDIFHRYRSSVGKSGPFVHGKGDGHPVLGQLNVLGDKSVFGKRFIKARHGKGFKNKGIKTVGCIPFQGKRVHLVKTAEVMQGQGSALEGSRG